MDKGDGGLAPGGEDDFAEAVKASPIRFVGPAYMGGRGVGPRPLTSARNPMSKMFIITDSE
jgi:hypothetical protein